MALPVIILLLVSYGYTLLIFLFYLEIDQDPELPGDLLGISQKVSVVVPFRNEEAHLPGLLEDFSRQSFPPEQMEIIFVDDHSSDGSASILLSKKDKNKQFSYLALPPGMSGKKKALSYGIQHALHERIIQVDADCRVGPGFISAHMAFLEQHPADLVAGIVSTRRGSGSFLEIFERLDNLGLVGVSAGSFNLGRPMMCSGANLSYSRKLYEDSRSFDPEGIASGDDMFLMIAARKLSKTLSFISARESIVRTKPQKDLRSLITQRIRWGSKAPRYNMLDIQLLAILVALANISMLLMPLWIILFSGLWPWLLGAWGFKTLADFMLLYRISGICGTRRDLRLFIPVSLLYYPYFLVTVLGSLRGRSSWKEPA